MSFVIIYNMQLSKKSLTDLRNILLKEYGENFNNKLNDEELNEIGEMLLVVTGEALKLKVRQASKNTIQ